MELNHKIIESKSGSSEYIVFLHGFTGSLNDWNEILPLLKIDYNILLIDLPGHGKSTVSDDPAYFSAGSMTRSLKELILKYTSSQPVLAGYSMGGRAALTLASAHPELPKALILESTSPGIREDYLRDERIKSDDKLAGFIEQNTIEQFVDYWMNLTLFDSQKLLPKKKLEAVKNAKLQNSRTGLASSLRGFGRGMMDPLYDKLKDIPCRTLLITGELDQNYSAINSGLTRLFPSAEHLVIENAGHNVHLERPEEYAAAVTAFISEL